MSTWQTKKITRGRRSGIRALTVRRASSSRAVKHSSVKQANNGKHVGKWIISAIVFIALLYIVYYVLPRVEITVVPETRELVFEETVLLFTSSEGSQEESGLPVLLVGSLSKDTHVSALFRATGEKDIGERAQGRATFYNHTGLMQEVFVEDGLETLDGVDFTVTQFLVIPPATVSPEGEVVPGTVDSSIVALEPGEDSNIQPQKIFIKSVSADKQHKIFAQTTDALSGGTSEKVRVISQEDIEQAKEELKNTARREILESLREEQELEDSKQIIEETFVFTKELFSSEIAINQEREEFEYELEALGSLLVYDKGTWSRIVRDLLSNKVFSNEKFLTDTPQTLVFSDVVKDQQGITSARVKATWHVSTALEVDQFIDKVRGKREADARRIILSHPAVTDVRFNWNLAISRRVPSIISHVIVKLGR